VRIDWDGSALDELLHSSHGVSVKALEEPGRAVEAEARRLAPVRTGATRDGITIRSGSDSDGPYVDIISTAEDEKGRPKGLFIEIGTNDTPAQPYLRPALDVLR
jgi:hypothetical protein